MHEPPKFAAIITIASLVVNISLHLASFVFKAPFGFFAMLPAFFLTFLAMLSAIGLLNHFAYILMPSLASGFFRNLSKQFQEKLDFNGKILAAVSWPWRGVLLAAILYAVLNAGLSFYLSEGGVPAADEFGYVLTDHGRTIRPLTEQEYHRLSAFHLHTMTSFMMVASVISIIGTFVVYPKIAQEILRPSKQLPK